MASYCASSVSRHAIASLVVPVSAAIIGTDNGKWKEGSFPSDEGKKKSHSSCFCEASSKVVTNDDGGVATTSQKVMLKKRMTSIGRFSMKSETTANLSIPTFFVALGSKNPTSNNEKGLQPIMNHNRDTASKAFSVPEFESVWLKRGMHKRHPRFHSRVARDDDRYFELETDGGDDPLAQVHQHAKETLHTSVYREDLKQRIEKLLTSPLNIMEKLWEVQISNGPLGSSGAISKRRVMETTSKDNENIVHPLVESILLFRAHHALADGVSLIAAIGDLADEAEDLRKMVKEEIHKRRNKKKNINLLKKFQLYLQKLIWFLTGSIRVILYHLYLTMTTKQNPFLQVLGELSSQHLDCTRTVSWIDAAPLEEVKMVTKAIGPKVTINDLFVSCVCAAVARQLAEHRARKSQMTDIEQQPSSGEIVRHFNVGCPVHLGGGIIPPGRGIGNLIGAFLARVPGEMMMSCSNDMNGTPPSASERTIQVSSSLSRHKSSPAPILSYVLAKAVADWFPESWAKTLFSKSNANVAVIVSNSRGPPMKLHINEKPVEVVAGFFPLPPGVPVGVIVQSYAGTVSLSVTAEKWAVPDADKFIGWILEEYYRLCVETSK